jgi:hypothetical protein
MRLILYIFPSIGESGQNTFFENRDNAGSRVENENRDLVILSKRRLGLAGIGAGRRLVALKRLPLPFGKLLLLLGLAGNRHVLAAAVKKRQVRHRQN